MAARHDRTTDPHITESLLLARRGTAYFSHHLARLTAEDMTGPSQIPGWTRAHVVAHVGYHARKMAHLVEEVRTGAPVVESIETGARGVDYGATLPDTALRNLHAHAAVHLNVEWRDLPAEKWNTSITLGEQHPVPVRETVWTRAIEVWVHAVDLNVGARFEDFPPGLLERLLHESLKDWKERSEHEANPLQLILRPAGYDAGHPISQTTLDPTRETDGSVTPGHTILLEGTPAAITRWALGRSTAGVTCAEGAVPILRPWAHHTIACPSQRVG